ncbi:MAG: ParB/RepB/Spo0J family partition protein [Candidatus Kariarchaeaceae archaeon]
MVSAAKYPQPEEAAHIISYNNKERKWLARRGNGQYGPAEAIELFNTQKAGTAYSEKERYVVLFEDNGINTKLTLVCDRHKVFSTNYSIPFYQIKKKLVTLKVKQWVGLDEEFKYDDYVDDPDATPDELFKKKLDGNNLISYDVKTKEFYLYSRPAFNHGPSLTYEEVVKALSLEFASLTCQSNLYLEFIMKEEGNVSSTLSYKSQKNKEDHYLVITKQEFKSAEKATDYYSIFDISTRNIDFLDFEEFEELKKLEASKPDNNDSSSVLQSDEGELQKQEVEPQTEFNREILISELQDGKIVKIPIDYLEEEEFYQVRLLENKEYDSILEAVRLEKASPIEVFIDVQKIFIIDGYTRRKAALETTKPLTAFLSSAKTKEEAEARAFQANTGRGNLTPVEEANFISKFREKYTIKNDADLAERLSKTKDIISRRRKLAAATDKIQELYLSGHITLLQTEAIGSIPPLDQQRAYEDDWFDNRGKMTRNHPQGKVTIVSVEYSKENHPTKRGMIPHHKYALELSNKKSAIVFSSTGSDFAKVLKKGEIVAQTEDTLEVVSKRGTSYKMSKNVCESWPTADELNKQTDLEIIPEEELELKKKDKTPKPVLDSEQYIPLSSSLEFEKADVKLPSLVEEVIKDRVKVDQIFLISSNEQENHFRVHLTNDSLYDLFSDKSSHCVIKDLYEEEGETKDLFFDGVNLNEINFTMDNTGCVFCYPLRSQIKVDIEFYTDTFNELAEKIPDMTDEQLAVSYKALEFLQEVVINTLKSRHSLETLKKIGRAD